MKINKTNARKTNHNRKKKYVNCLQWQTLMIKLKRAIETNSIYFQFSFTSVGSRVFFPFDNCICLILYGTEQDLVVTIELLNTKNVSVVRFFYRFRVNWIGKDICGLEMHHILIEKKEQNKKIMTRNTTTIVWGFCLRHFNSNAQDTQQNDSRKVKSKKMNILALWFTIFRWILCVFVFFIPLAKLILHFIFAAYKKYARKIRFSKKGCKMCVNTFVIYVAHACSFSVFCTHDKKKEDHQLM